MEKESVMVEENSDLHTDVLSQVVAGIRTRISPWATTAMAIVAPLSGPC